MEGLEEALTHLWVTRWQHWLVLSATWPFARCLAQALLSLANTLYGIAVFDGCSFTGHDVLEKTKGMQKGCSISGRRSEVYLSSSALYQIEVYICCHRCSASATTHLVHVKEHSDARLWCT